MMRAIQRRSAALAAAALACAAGTAAGQYVKLVPADGGEYDNFGFSVSMSGDLLGAGAPGADYHDVFRSGRAYLYEWTGTWSWAADISPSDAETMDFFGSAVAVEGERAVVGAPGFLSNKQGKAYVFERQDGAWVEVARLVPSDVDIRSFGSSVALSGGSAIVGTQYAVDGAAYIFEAIDGVWTEVAALEPPGPGGRFGYAVALQGETAVVGAPLLQLDGPEGTVFVFEKIGGVWTESARLTGGALCGRAVALDGDVLLAGSPWAYDESGAVDVFERVDTEWVRTAELRAPNGRQHDYFGMTVSASGDAALVGMGWACSGCPISRSAAYLYRRAPSGVWSLETTIAQPDGDADDRFASAVSLTSDWIALGAPDDVYSSEGGAVYIAPAPRDRSPDFNGDGDVDTRDVIAFLDAWAGQDLSADWDWNWRIDTRDLIAFLNDWAAEG